MYESKFYTFLKIAISVAVCVWLVKTCIKYNSAGSGGDKDEHPAWHYEYAFKEIMKENLWDSKDADYDWKVSTLTDEGFYGVVEIRAKNAFGAYRTQTFIVTGTKKGKITWREK